MRTLKIVIALSIVSTFFVIAANSGSAAQNTEGIQDISGERNYLHGYPAVNADGTVNVIIECPAGTTAKWQVEPDGVLRRQYKAGKLYDLDYLPFLVNYGMIPRTLVSKASGGEQEQLDIQVLGNVIERGSIVRVHVIGALALTDSGSTDDKLLAVVEGTEIGSVRNVSELEEKFPGITRILEMWWINFKGQNVMKSYGYVGSKSAARLIDAAADGYDRQRQEAQ